MEPLAPTDAASSAVPAAIGNDVIVPSSDQWDDKNDDVAIGNSINGHAINGHAVAPSSNEADGKNDTAAIGNAVMVNAVNRQCHEWQLDPLPK